MYAYRRAAAALPILGIVLTGVMPARNLHAASLQRPTRRSIVALVTTTVASINGEETTLPSVRNDTKLMVALEPLATKLGIGLKRHGGALYLDVDGSWISVNPDDIVVRDGAAPMMRLGTAPERRAGQTFIDAADVSNLLDVSATRDGNRLAVARKKPDNESAQGGFTVREIPTPKPLPKPSPAAVTAFHSYDNVPDGKRLLGRAAFDMNSDPYGRYYNAMFDGGTQHLHASVYANGTTVAHPNIGGTLRVGEGEKHVSLGGITDPLYGDLFSGAGSNGVEFENTSGVTLAWGNSTVGDRHTVAVGRRTTSSNMEVALASQYQSSIQPLFGVQQWRYAGSAYFSQELWLGMHGIGADLHYRTAGRLFGEAKLGFAGAGLPLVLGDDATQIDVGYDFTKSFGLRAGFAGGHDLNAQPMLQAYVRTHGIELSAQRFGSQNLFTADLASGTVWYDFGPQISQASAQLQFERPHGLIETTDYLSRGANFDVTVDYRLKREAPAFSFGGEIIRSGNLGRIGPVIGFASPITGGLNAEVQFHPLIRGNGLRFAVQQAIFASNAPRQRFIDVALLTPTDSPMFVAIDGTRTEALSTGTTRVPIPSGNHYVSVQSGDGSLASPEQRVVDGNPVTLTFPLWPVRTIRGKLSIPKNVLSVLQPAPSLAGITLILQPGNVTAQTDEDGSYAFPSQALSPDTTIAIDRSTLPDGLAAPDPQSISSDGTVDIILQSSKKIEKVIF